MVRRSSFLPQLHPLHVYLGARMYYVEKMVYRPAAFIRDDRRIFFHTRVKSDRTNVNISGTEPMKKDDFFKQYHYDYELNAKFKQRQKNFTRYFKMTNVFSVLAAVIPLLLGKFELAFFVFASLEIVFWLGGAIGAIYVFTGMLRRPRCKNCGKRMLKKYIFTGYGGEEQLHFHCPGCKIYVDTNIRKN